MSENLSQRLKNVLINDKAFIPQKIMPALKADSRDLLRQYAELNSEITIELQESTCGYGVIVIANIARFKQ